MHCFRHFVTTSNWVAALWGRLTTCGRMTFGLWLKRHATFNKIQRSGNEFAETLH
jgi:hypothetical protein